MPFLNGASGITVSDCEMNDVAGDLNKNQISGTATYTNSHNKTVCTTAGAHNHSFKDENTYSPSSSNTQTIEQRERPQPKIATSANPLPTTTPATPPTTPRGNKSRK